MTSLAQRIKAVDWDRVTEELNTVGWSMLKGILQPEECDSIAALSGFIWRARVSTAGGVPAFRAGQGF